MNQSIPSEFAGFLRETGMRAFDQLAVRAKDLDPPLRSFLRNWSRLSESDKIVLFLASLIAGGLGVLILWPRTRSDSQ